jgi:hypothetical protein
MALRFKRTIDVSPHMFSTREHADTDWVFYCGAWQAGRIHENLRPVKPRIVYVWSFTGATTPEAPVRTRGEAPSVAAAKKQLAAAMRAWAIWAGMRQPKGGGTVAPRWVLTSERIGPDHPINRTTCEPATDWMLMSGGLTVGRVFRPAAGPKNDPLWMLLMSGPMAMPGASAGLANSIDAAKGELLAAWQAWLEWADLGAPA